MDEIGDSSLFHFRYIQDLKFFLTPNRGITKNDKKSSNLFD